MKNKEILNKCKNCNLKCHCYHNHLKFDYRKIEEMQIQIERYIGWRENSQGVIKRLFEKVSNLTKAYNKCISELNRERKKNRKLNLLNTYKQKLDEIEEIVESFRGCSVYCPKYQIGVACDRNCQEGLMIAILEKLKANDIDKEES